LWSRREFKKVSQIKWLRGLMPHSKYSLRENPEFLKNLRSKNNILKENV
jgi:hypothetical protein